MAGAMTDRLRAIAQQGARALTADDRRFIEQASADFAVPFARRGTACGSCYIDQAVAIYRKILQDVEMRHDNSVKYPKIVNYMAKKKNALKTAKKRLKRDVDVYVNGARLNAATCSTADDVERWLAIGVPDEYFEDI